MLLFLNEIDTQLLLAINGYRSGWADSFMYLFSGKLIWVPMYASILYVILKNYHWKLALGCVMAIGLTIVFADQVGASIMRPYFERLRPSNLDNPISDLVQIVNGKRGGRYGFPSCHAANTFGLAFFIFYLFRNKLLTIFLMLWALVTCYSRSYLGVHYPGDLLVGAVLGFIGASLCYWLFTLYAHRIGIKKPTRVAFLLLPIIIGGTTIVGMAVYSLF
ncbi:MAG: phosphatase PAP2 family protein [Mediterranea massiliensis]|nr:phosphatase PAP2 family protein [Mediterranea massiliensis]